MGKAASLANIGSIADSSLGFRNRIINGNMTISQRSGTSSVTVDGANVVNPDRWTNTEIGNGAFTAQQVTDAPAGFNYSLKVTTTTLQTGTLNAVSRQSIEGFNIADLGWGTASAKSITLSFWVKSSLTGSFGGSLRNDAGDRCFPFSYTISSANTWEYETITIPGDITGTWATGNTTGVTVWFSHGTSSTGTAGAWTASDARAPTGSVFIIQTLSATWQVTGVQFEVGSTATSFDYRPYGTELALCQRYYYRITPAVGLGMFGSSWNENTTRATGQVKFPVTMRTRPTALEQTGTAANYGILHKITATTCSAVPAYEIYTNADIGVFYFTVASGLTAGEGSALANASGVTTAYLAWSAEL